MYTTHTVFTLNDARKVLQLFSVPFPRRNFGGKSREFIGFQQAFLKVQLTMAMRLTSQEFRELMAPNGADRAILGKMSNQIRCVFFHRYMAIFYLPPFLPRLNRRLKTALQNAIFLCQVRYELAPVNQTPFTRELHLLGALVLLLMMMNLGNQDTT